MTLALPSYLGHPVLDWVPDWSGASLGQEFRQTKTRWDSPGGKVSDDAIDTPRPRTARTLRYVLESRTEVLDAEDFLRGIARGRFGAFWVPGWLDDLKLTAGCAADEQELFCTPIGFARYYAGGGLGREHVACFTRTGTVYRRIVGNGVRDNGDERITLDSDLGKPLLVTDRVCFLQLCRADSDDLAIDWMSWSTGVLELPLIDLPREAA